MTDTDLKRIEESLKIRLPDEYRRLMLAYPFAEDSFANDCEIPNDADRVLATNLDLRENGFFGLEWPHNFFSFGGDGSGNEYYLDLSLSPSPVFLADHEDSEFSQLSPTFDSWLENARREYREWEEEERLREERRGNRSRWQFWR